MRREVLRMDLGKPDGVYVIHLGTALHSRSGLTSFVTYDKRPLDAAQAAGLPVDSLPRGV